MINKKTNCFLGQLDNIEFVVIFAKYAIETGHPEVTFWETCTPYFDTRNLHFYINCLGFAAVEFYNPKHKDPNVPDGDDGSDFFFRIEKNN